MIDASFTYSDISFVEFTIGIVAVIGFSFLCAWYQRNSFSMNVFLSSVAIGIAILVWIPVVPASFIVVSILIIAGMWFGDRFFGGTP